MCEEEYLGREKRGGDGTTIRGGAAGLHSDFFFVIFSLGSSLITIRLDGSRV